MGGRSERAWIAGRMGAPYTQAGGRNKQTNGIRHLISKAHGDGVVLSR